MKKRQVLLMILTAVVFLTCVVPSLAERFYAESQNTAFCVALRGDKTLAHFDEAEQLSVLKGYRKSGITTLAVYENDLEFDEEMMALAEEAELSVALFLDGTCEKDTAFYEKLYALAEAHKIDFIGVSNPEKDVLVPVDLAEFLKRYDATLVLIEQMSQLSNERFIGYDDAVRAAEGKILRCYECWQEPARTISSGDSAVDYADVLVHQMENSAKDRNTRFLLVNQVISGTEDAFLQAEQTQVAVRNFCDRMIASGYAQNAEVDYTYYNPDHRPVSAGTVFIGVMMALFMICVLLKKRSAWLEYSFLALGVVLFGLTFFLPESIVLLYPTAYAVLAGCFSLTLCAFLGEKLATRLASTFWYTVCMVVLALGILMLSGAILLSLLAGSDYYLNNLIFRGVKLTLVAPIGFAAVFMWLFYSKKTLKEQLVSLPQTAKQAVKCIRIYHIILLLLVGAAGVLYLMRSGNAGISLFENNLRNFLSDISGARPRTKEFLIGWPMLVLWLFYLKRDNLLWKWIFGIGAALLFASVTNTFCHVFTDGFISLHRTVNGLLFSLPVVLLISAGNALVLRLINKLKR